MDNIDQIDQFFENSHYDFIRLILSISGLWPFHTLRRRRMIYLAMILVLGFGFIFEIMEIMSIWHNTFELINALPILLLGVVALIKVTYAVYMLPEIKLLLINIQEYCLSSKSDEETEIYNSHGLYGRKCGYIYTSLLVGHFIVFQSITLLTKLINTKSKEKRNITLSNTGNQTGLSYPVNSMIDVDIYHVPIFIYTTMCEIFYLLLIIAFDILYVTLVEYCCGLFESLRYRLENAFDFENNNGGLILTQNTSYSNIVYCIRRHTETIQFIAIMESIYSLLFLLNMGFLVIFLGIPGFQMITNMEKINNFITYSIYFNGLLITIFFKNWLGQKIIDSSEKVFESAYNSKWYNMPVATQKLLLMIMMISKKPLKLTVSKLFAMSYETFYAVIRLSLSYFMLLRSLQ